MEPRTARSLLDRPAARLGLGVALLALIIGLVVYFGRDKHFPRTDPNFHKQTDVVIEGTVYCNGVPLAGGYVVAWQGGPPVEAKVEPDGTFHMSNAPLGKCILTYCEFSSETNITKQDKEQEGDAQNVEKLKDAKKKEIGPPSKDNGLAKAKDFPPGDKKAGKDAGFMPKIKGGLFGNQQGPPIPLTPEQKQTIASAGKKYGDPTRKEFELETRKGTNTFSLLLTIP